MNLKKSLFILFSAIFLKTSLFSESISKIKFDGLKKTKESYMQNLLKDYVGKDESEVNLKEIETILQAEGLFSEVNISLENENTEQNSEIAKEEIKVDNADSIEENLQKNPLILKVSVKEKITFIPLPFASYSSDGFLGGFMLMDMNAFGKKFNLVSGGIFSKDMQMALLTFSKPTGTIESPGFSSASSFSHNENTITNFNDDTLFEFDSISFHQRLAVSSKFGKYFSASCGLGYFYSRFFKDDLDDLHQWILSSSVNFNKVDWNGWYLISKGATVGAEVGYSTEWEIIESVSFKANLQIPFLERNRFMFNVSGTLENNKNITSRASRANIGNTIMKSGFKTEKIGGAMFCAEEALFRHKVATVSVYETYEAAIAEDYDESFVYCHGPGAGLKLYLKQIAFPAMNMGFSYNVNQNFFNFVISIGMGM